MRAARLLFLLYGVMAGHAGLAQETRIVVQRTALAGFSHHVTPEQWVGMREGDNLELVLERANPYDPQAVQVFWRGQLIGYLPRTENGAVARALDRGMALTAAISKRREHPDPRQRLEIEVSARLNGRP